MGTGKTRDTASTKPPINSINGLLAERDAHGRFNPVVQPLAGSFVNDVQRDESSLCVDKRTYAKEMPSIGTFNVCHRRRGRYLLSY